MNKQYIFTFDSIIIIESLGERDVKTGNQLFENLKIRQSIRPNTYNVNFVRVATKNEFLQALLEIGTLVKKKNILPYLHIEMHGSEDYSGLVTSSGQIVKWEELKSALIDINELTKNNLCVSMATCFGAYMFGVLDPSGRAPFNGFIGSWETIEYEQLYNFTSFFEEIFDSQDLNRALSILNKDGLEYNRVNLIYYNAEDVFDKIWNAYEDKYYSKQGFEDRVNNLFNIAITDPDIVRQHNIALLRGEIANFYIQAREPYRDKAKKHFLFLE